MKILYAEDEMGLSMAVSEVLKREGFEVTAVMDGLAADEILQKEHFDLVVLDIMMPDMSGYQFCELLKENPDTKDIPVIFVSAASELDDKMKGFQVGAVDFISKPFDYGEVAMRVNTHLKMYQMKQELEDSNRRLSIIVSEQAKKYDEEQKRLLKALAKITEGSNATGMTKHLENVAYNARLLAQALNFTEKYENQISKTYIEAVELAGAVHDIGKLTVPKEILDKPTKLTETEWEIMKHHTDNGDELIRAAYPDVEDNTFVKGAWDGVRSHHVDWDGSGYPDGLKGSDIPLSARIVKIVDVYDSILSDRCYRSAYTKEESLAYMKQGSKSRFDPYILEVFLKIEKQLRK
mgnify:CR=1 FL=1